jgi:hypothetical protein
MPISLQDKVVLITGASSGFGADAARLFARKGSIVFLAARRMDRLGELAEEINGAGGKAFPIQLDVTVLPQIEQAVQTVINKVGRIDILINNAGVGRFNWFEKLHPAADIDMQIDVNLRGAMHVTRVVLPSMLAHRSGHIINVSSVAGLIPAPTYSVYAATKYGIRGFSSALRREVTSMGIHVSSLYPGPASTEFGLQTGDNPFKKNFRVPRWINLSSEYIARRIVGVARHPRRALVIPWWFSLLVAIDTLFPGLVDWLVNAVFVKRFHQN